MKKLLCTILLCLLCITVFAACDSTDTPNSDSTSDPSTGEKKEYTITWISEAGATLGTTKVKEGTVPSYEYTVADTAEWDYTMAGWATTQEGDAAQLVAATADATYYAKVTKVKQKYTISFVSNGGSDTAAITAEYGQTVSVPTSPTKANHRFVGWFADATLQNAVSWPITLVKDETVYAAWNEIVDVPALLRSLLDGYSLNPYKAIPNSMKPGAAGTLLTNAGSIVNDYSSNVNVSSISSGGFGEQWYMVLENLQQSNTFFNVLSVVEGLTTTSVSAFNNYWDSNPGNTAHHSFASGIYSVTIDFDGETLYYVLDYTASLPVLGEQTIQIAMSMDAETEEKTVRIQFGDANALKYTLNDNSYEFYIMYLGVRRAYFKIEETATGVYEGHLKEFLTVSGVAVESAADFYINGNYVTAVGNKASGMLGFTGYICELYDTSTGKMLGYEVRETKDIPILGDITFHTLWFDLSYVSGITSIRYVEPSGNNETGTFYVNGSSSAWKPQKNTFTRKFDIEFRTQYFYTYNAQNDAYEVVELQVPMLFVQEENYNTLVEDVEDTNSITISISLPSAKLNKLLTEYDSTVDVFIENKAAITTDIIITAIGDKKTFAP